MYKEIRTEIEINAPGGKVWGVLTDFENFSAWNPFVVSVSGKPSEGEILKIKVQLPEGRQMKFTPLVLKAEAEKELRWVGKLPLNAFTGEHYFKIERVDANRVRFIHGESFSGWMVGLIWALDGEKIEKGYQLMNEALKKKVEN